MTKKRSVYLLIPIFLFTASSCTSAKDKPCPIGAELAGNPPPNGTKQWCQKLDKKQNYVKHGPFIMWYKNGLKAIEVEFREGNMDGRWIAWYENGQKMEEGLVRPFDPSKSQEDNLAFVEFEGKAGKKHGQWITWHSNGSKGSTCEFKNGLENGLCTYWNQIGQKRQECEFKNGLENGLCTYWNQMGQKRQECEFPNGEITLWDDYGNKVAQGTLKNGHIQGTWTEWYEDGLKKMEGIVGSPIPEGSYVSACNRSATKNGQWIYWEKNGNKKELAYEDGLEVMTAAPSIPRVYANMHMPDGWWTDPKIIEAGKSIYEGTWDIDVNCASCHGKNGKPIKKGMRDLGSSQRMKFFSDSYLSWKISEGVPCTKMKAYKAKLTEDERWKVIAYFHTFSHSGTPAVHDDYIFK